MKSALLHNFIFFSSSSALLLRFTFVSIEIQIKIFSYIHKRPLCRLLFCSHVCYYFITMEEVDCQTASLSQYKIVALQQHSILWGNWSYSREFSEKKSVNYEIYNLCNYPFALSHWQVHGQSTSYQLVAFQHGYL